MPIQDLIQRYPIEDDYLRVLGFTVFMFSIMEWNAANCCERMQTGYLTNIYNKEATAANIAQKLVKLTKRLADSEEKEKLLDAAKKFETLVSSDRNHLLHGYPGMINGKAVLSRVSKDGSKSFELYELEKFAESCHECSSVFNHALYNILAVKSRV